MTVASRFRHTAVVVAGVLVLVMLSFGGSSPQPAAAEFGSELRPASLERHAVTKLAGLRSDPMLHTVAHTLNYATNGSRTAVISRTDQRVSLYEADGSFVDQFPCATGIYYPLVGAYRVGSRKPSGVSPDDGSRFRYFTVFAKSHRGVSIGFHAIPVDRAGNPIGGLGKPISHGCVRLANDKAAFMYEWAVDGTRVVVNP